MRRTIFALALLAGVSEANAQDRVVYRYMYDGYGIKPGLTVHGNGFYTKDYPGGHSWYHYGYQPPRSGYRPVPRQYGGPYRHSNGLTPRGWMFYYEGMQYSAYNVNSPVWNW